MIKQIFILLAIMLVLTVTAGIIHQPVSYDECVKKCQQAYKGNPKAIQSCISRCR